MIYLGYIILGIIAFTLGSLIIMYRETSKVVEYFSENPNGLPNKLPDNIQNFKELVGEEQFQELYDKFQKENR